MAEDRILVTNRQALRDYNIEKSYEAGIQLVGGEVKSLRAGQANLKGSFAKIDAGEVYLYSMHISPYEYAHEDYNPLRKMKLLFKV